MLDPLEEGGDGVPVIIGSVGVVGVGIGAGVGGVGVGGVGLGVGTALFEVAVTWALPLT